MTNYLAALTFAALIASAACADDTHPAAAKPAPAPAPRPVATAQAAAPAKPAAQPASAAKPAAAAALPHYVQTGGSLDFTFEQAGAMSKGSFRQFATTLDYDEKNLAAGKLNVTVQIASLNTQDKDRDAALLDADLFDAKKYPTATYVASSLAKGAAGVEAVGKLTIRGVAKDVRLPLAIRSTANGVELSGEVKIKRLDFGIGQGEWKSTEWVGDVVTISYKVALRK